MYHVFLLWLLFMIFSLSLVLSTLIMMHYWCSFLHVYCAWGLVELLESMSCEFSSNLENLLLRVYFFISLFPLFSSPFDALITHTLGCLKLSHSLLMSFPLFNSLLSVLHLGSFLLLCFQIHYSFILQCLIFCGSTAAFISKVQCVLFYFVFQISFMFHLNFTNI